MVGFTYVPLLLASTAKMSRRPGSQRDPTVTNCSRARLGQLPQGGAVDLRVTVASAGSWNPRPGVGRSDAGLGPWRW